MKVLVVHNRYQHRGGEDVVVEAEISLLRSQGHVVQRYERRNDEVAQVSRGALALQSIWSARTVSDSMQQIANFRPDIIHVHNTFPLISPAVYWIADRHRIPVVQTLHNYRMLCPQAMLLRDGLVCTACIGKIPWRGAVRGCYRESVAQSTVAAVSFAAHRWLGTWDRKVTRYIALNEFSRAKFIEGGLPQEKIVVKPNFVNRSFTTTLTSSPEEASFLFVGRLSEEKGTRVLAKAVNQLRGRIRVRVIGAGPEESVLGLTEGVELLGFREREFVQQQMARATALVMPSVWYETFGLVIVEAFASGLPVIASRLGAMESLVRHGETGLLFNPGDAADLADKMRWAVDHPEEMLRMGAIARDEYHARYTPEENYRQLVSIYEDSLRSCHAA